MKFRLAGLCAPVVAAVFAIALTPSSVLADANPNNHGHHYHYGWANHHSPPPAPAPPPGGGPGTSGPHNSIVAAVPVALTGQAPTDLAPAAVPPETPVLAPPAPESPEAAARGIPPRRAVARAGDRARRDVRS